MIETARFILKPLTYGQLVSYMKCDHSLEKELNLNKSHRTIPVELQEALERTILPAVADQTKDFRFSTLWTAILKQSKLMVGDLCIYGEPDIKGAIEIGYGTYEEFRGKGYMTEIVSGIIEWSKTQPSVKTILASTEKSNPASSRVLEKNNFVLIDDTETEFRWQLEIRKKISNGNNVLL